MLATVTSATLLGVEAVAVQVEVHLANGLPQVTIVGLAGTAVQESRQRVRAALRSCDLPFPVGRVVINLAPADVRKEGPSFDLPIALALLVAQGVLPQRAVVGALAVGELALDGTLRAVRGTTALALFAVARGATRLLLPHVNGAEAGAVIAAAAVGADPEVVAAPALPALLAHLRGRTRLPLPLPSCPSAPERLDTADVRGQQRALRALEIAAAGGHNVLLSGPPGAGKTMLARRLPALLPALERREAIEVTRIHSLVRAGPLGGLIRHPPFRAPHATASAVALIGGGSHPTPGEVSLAHRGVLFLDELPEFARASLEGLRQPLEDGVVTVSRLRQRVRFPARFQLIASRNPCPCGFAGEDRCRCTAAQLQRYRARLSGPLLDRIDMHVTVPRLTPDELLQADPAVPSSLLRERVAAALQRSRDRQQVRNAELHGAELRAAVVLDGDAARLMRRAVERFMLSGRGFDRLLKVARTVADLEGRARVGVDHLDEALAFRETW